MPAGNGGEAAGGQRKPVATGVARLRLKLLVEEHDCPDVLIEIGLQVVLGLPERLIQPLQADK